MKPQLFKIRCARNVVAELVLVGAPPKVIAAAEVERDRRLGELLKESIAELAEPDAVQLMALGFSSAEVARLSPAASALALSAMNEAA